jgi:hypothetical protein
MIPSFLEVIISETGLTVNRAAPRSEEARQEVIQTLGQGGMDEHPALMTGASPGQLLGLLLIDNLFQCY